MIVFRIVIGVALWVIVVSTLIVIFHTSRMNDKRRKAEEYRKYFIQKDRSKEGDEL